MSIRETHWLRSGVIALLASMVIGCGGEEGETTATAADPADNRAPTISGQAPASVQQGNNYVYQPTASDPDGDSLSFSVQNKPVWAEFDVGSGRFWGTPTEADVGLYSGIGISVSDGELSDSVTFSVEVVQLADGSVTLSWLAPTQNADGSPLADLSGYRIYYGTSEGSYPNVVTVSNPGLTTVMVESLSPNTYYFVATAYNSAGVESEYSNIAVKTVM